MRLDVREEATKARGNGTPIVPGRPEDSLVIKRIFETNPARQMPPANIHKAMSLVPAEVESFFDLCEHQYLGALAMRDFAREFRAISHAQIELLAARVSAMNRCFY